MRHATMRFLLASVLTCSALGVAGCEPEGPAEKAGKAVDEAVDKGADAVQDAGDKVKDAAD